jgi:DNA-binding PucR family transcriptional regulator
MAPESPIARALAAFARVGPALEQAAVVDDLLRVIVCELRNLVGVDRCSIALRDEETGLFRGCVGQLGEENIDDVVKRSLAGIAADAMTHELAHTKRPVIVSNARNDPRIIRSNAILWRMQSMMVVPLVFEDDVIGLTFLDDVDSARAFSAEDAEVSLVFAGLAAVAVTHARSRIELRSNLDAANRELAALRRSAAVEERLGSRMLAGSGLDALVEDLAQVLGKPCAVYAADHTRLATASPQGADGAMLPRLLEQPCVRDPQVHRALEIGGVDRAFVVPPLPDAGVMHRHLVAPIVGDDELWGRLLVMECGTRFAGSDMLTLRRAARLIALHMRAEQSAIEADWNAGASLAAELLGGCSDSTLVKRRAERLGVALDAPHAVVLIGPRGECSAPVSDFRAVVAAFLEVAPELRVHATKVADGVAALIEVPATSDARMFAEWAKDLLTEVCEQLGGTAQIAAAISTVRSDAAAYPAAYAEAQQVLACIRRFGGEAGPGALGTGRVFLATSDAEAVKAFADSTFGDLVRDPAKKHLLATLGCLFDNMGSIRRCALRLGLHENTIRYRLTRIEELTGMSITHDPDAQLGARLALLVLMLQGKLSAIDAVRDALPPGEEAPEPLRLVGAIAG